MPHITLLALPGALSSSLSLPMEMLSAADQLTRVSLRQHSSLRRCVAGPTAQPVRMVSGMTLMVDACWHDISDTDLVIVPSLWRDPLVHLRRHRSLLDWLQQQAAHRTILCAAGTGTWLLAEAGLLDGAAATTHWFYFDQFAARYPAVQLKRRHLITQADNIYCAGSVNSVADLMIHFIGEFYGAEIARRVEAQFSPESRRSFESHAYRTTGANAHGDELVIEAQELLRTSRGELRMPELAERLGISLRSLNRRFRQATGVTPQQWLQQHRLESARELLRTTNLSICEIAATVGYLDPAYFGRLFREQMKQTPREYRQAVRGKLFHLSP
ncbi:MAG: helix-turn-helix domain-containing protein [Spongiibacteraceae bacterium]|jgi:transcriptional regulator GlxA family with amidase domain|nr:helix-turn-helix domain-containing protein [Spongiibacteraceae bacterium]